MSLHRNHQIHQPCYKIHNTIDNIQTQMLIQSQNNKIFLVVKIVIEEIISLRIQIQE